MSSHLPNLPPDQDGYHRLATLMTRDKNLAIFRRYDFVNTISLLSLQAELQELQADFIDQCRRDKAAGTSFSDSFKILKDSKSDQSRKLIALREKAREYNDLLTQVSNINGLETADHSQLEVLRDWLMDAKGGANFLLKSEARSWEDEEGSTFVRVGPLKGEQDMFTKLTTWILISVWHKYCCFWRTAGRPIDPETGMTSFNESKLVRAGTIIATVLSSTMPVISIFVLFIVKNTYQRIGIAAGFTAAFALMLAAFSSARRIEIFAATATFAAVEVVFIGSALNPGM